MGFFFFAFFKYRISDREVPYLAYILTEALSRVCVAGGLGEGCPETRLTKSWQSLMLVMVFRRFTLLSSFVCV